MKKYLFILLLPLLLAACKRKDDFKGTGVLAGRVFYYNPYSGDSTIRPIGGRKVYLAYYRSDTLNYIYSTVANSEGYFVFTNIDKTNKYDIFFNDTLNNVWYLAIDSALHSDSTNIKLLALPDNRKQNGLTVSVIDTAGNKIQSVVIAAYDNFDIFKADTAAKSSSGAAFTFTTGPFGFESKYNIAPGLYYLSASKTVGSLSLVTYDTVKVTTLGVKSKTMKVSPVPVVVSRPDSAIIVVVDSASYAVTGANAYLYSSYAAYSLDTATIPVAFSYSTTTTPTGAGIFPGVPPATYFVRANKTIGATTLRGIGNLTVTPSHTTIDTVRITR